MGAADSMSCVTLIFTVHEELGLANANELVAILHILQPEVIFLEVPVSAFDDYYVSHTRRNLESEAVCLFLESHPCTKLVPVDMPTPAREFFEDHEQLFMRVRQTSRVYRQLARVDRERQRMYGFAYLNSSYCEQHWAEMRKEELRVLAQVGDPGLTGIQAVWERTNELRELEMLTNIRQWCLEHRFERGALLVGAAHRHSLTEKLQAQTLINWSLLE